ncbi:MAG: hypothetical protein AAF065_12025 [Verrucomicrobiota bacterium]
MVNNSNVWRWKYNNLKLHRLLVYITSLEFAQKEVEEQPTNPMLGLRSATPQR